MKLEHPAIVTFEVTYSCNLSCNMCQTRWYQKDDRFKSRLSKEEIISTAKRLNKEEGARFFRFLGAEPLLHPDIIEIIIEVSKIGETWLTTNGTLITDKLAEDIVTSGLSNLCVSYHSPNEHYRGISPEKITKLTVAGIQAIDNAKKSFDNNLKVSVTNVITPSNYKELFKVEKLFKEYDVSVGFFPVHSMRPFMNDNKWNGQKAEYLGDDRLEPKELSFWQNFIFRTQLQFLKSRRKRLVLRPVYFVLSQMLFIYRDLQALFIYKPCTKPYERICIRADGKITSCEFLRTIEMGSIQDDKLWDTPLRQELIDITQKGKLSICRQCNRKSLYRPDMWPVKFIQYLKRK